MGSVFSLVSWWLSDNCSHYYWCCHCPGQSPHINIKCDMNDMNNMMGNIDTKLADHYHFGFERFLVLYFLRGCKSIYLNESIYPGADRLSLISSNPWISPYIWLSENNLPDGERSTTTHHDEEVCQTEIFNEAMNHPFYLIFPRLIILWSPWSKMGPYSGIIIIRRIWDHEIIMGVADAEEAELDKVFYFVFVTSKLVVVELTNALMYIWIFRFFLPSSFCPFLICKAYCCQCCRQHTYAASLQCKQSSTRRSILGSVCPTK